MIGFCSSDDLQQKRSVSPWNPICWARRPRQRPQWPLHPGQTTAAVAQCSDGALSCDLSASATADSNAWESYGFSKNATAPSASAAFFNPRARLAVMKMIGIPFRPRLCIRCATEKPSPTGIQISIRSRSGFCSTASFRPARPSGAVETEYPAASRRIASAAAILASSSTMSILFIT